VEVDSYILPDPDGHRGQRSLYSLLLGSDYLHEALLCLLEFYSLAPSKKGTPEYRLLPAVLLSAYASFLLLGYSLRPVLYALPFHAPNPWSISSDDTAERIA
jgi:hypothetical protein